MRVMHATAMPSLRANGRRASGSLLTAMEMNTRLSMPSTISSALRVSRVNQTFGSDSSSRNMDLDPYKGGKRTWGASEHARRQDQAPAQQNIHHQHEHRRRAHVLGAAGQLMEFGAVALDHRFNRRIGKLHRQHQQH